MNLLWQSLEPLQEILAGLFLARQSIILEAVGSRWHNSYES